MAAQGRPAFRGRAEAAEDLRGVGAVPGRRVELSDLHDDDDDIDDDADDANRVVGGLSRSVLTYLAKSIVEEPDAVVIETEERRNSVILRLHVAPSDMGRVIGRRGRVAQAIRSVVRAAGAKEGVDATVDIVD
ncbi:MAG: KH domain-containing protein [Actinobacteria bacterium]|nr:MAG: KH domain-containing protein [Actinomycetota bacterium]